jgi:hypothetical protein
MRQWLEPSDMDPRCMQYPKSCSRSSEIGRKTEVSSLYNRSATGNTDSILRQYQFVEGFGIVAIMYPSSIWIVGEQYSSNLSCRMENSIGKGIEYFLYSLILSDACCCLSRIKHCFGNTICEAQWQMTLCTLA